MYGNFAILSNSNKPTAEYLITIMKAMNLIYPCLSLLLLTQVASAAITLSLPSLQAPTEHVIREYTDATLAGIAARVPGIAQGQYTLSYRVNYSLRGHREDCCVDQEKGEKWVIDPEVDKLEFTIVITKAPKVYLPTWSKMNSVCTSARNEFAKYRQGVSEHEYGHHEVALQTFSDEKKGDILQLFQAEVIRDESTCIEGVDQDLEEASSLVYERTDERIDYATNQSEGVVRGAQEEAHESLPYPMIDTTQDCP